MIHLEALGLPRACPNTAVAPTTRSERNTRLPIFDMRPNRSLPPLECGFGVKPSQAAKCRPDLKPPGSGTSALTIRPPRQESGDPPGSLGIAPRMP